ncbi:hypothetical protein TSAR_002099 [Trichomalopsis sarcophagae]|uniref:Uncharacterized protein n=1 Tax=Trichomalopsis sarcophagae TaxID=543379 RepID=A0A232EPI1_9HYME|nr:hypothetical protein TSAR_002099 [Trichomalopsis sarcophagae]
MEESMGRSPILGEIEIDPHVQNYEVFVTSADVQGPAAISSTKNDVSNHLNKEKKIHIGWVHRADSIQKYVQLKAPLADNIETKYPVHKNLPKQKADEFLLTNISKYKIQAEYELRDSLPSYEDFDPLDYGYEICRTEKEGLVLLRIDVQDDLSRQFEYSEDLTIFNPDPHSILCDSRLLRGIADKQYGLGVIPYCNDNCQPLFTWKKVFVLVRRQGFAKR